VTLPEQQDAKTTAISTKRQMAGIPSENQARLTMMDM